MPSPAALVIGASRGLGLALAQTLHARGHTVYATVRSTGAPKTFPEGVRVLDGIDVATEGAGKKIVEGLKGQKLDSVWYVAGLLKPETFDDLKWEDQLAMYTICAVAPVFITKALVKSGALKEGSKLLIFSSEGGSIMLRTKDEGGGMFGHHGSKAAQNMIGKLLAIELHEKNIAVGLLHTKGAGFDQFYESGGAVDPAEAVPTILDFVDKFDHSQTGTFWAPRGPGDVGQAENVLGKNLPTPLQLPW